MKFSCRLIGLGLLLGGVSANVFARDIAVFTQPIQKGKFASSLLYGHIKSTEDFDGRGQVDFKSHTVGARFGFGVTDRTAVAIQGGSYVNPQVDGQGSTWRSRSGYFYGIDLYNEVFPATELWPGLQAQLGVLGSQVPLDRLETASGITLIDQNMSGIEYHGALLAIWKWTRLAPYMGVRAFGSSVRWRNNQPGAAGLAQITGHADGNVSFVAGTSVRILNEVRLLVEGRFVNETVLSAGIQLSAF